jgi:Spy/CpxP family protein refolding chaperone
MNKKRFVTATAVIAAMLLIIGTVASHASEGAVMMPAGMQKSGRPGMPPPHGSPLLRCISQMDNMTSETKSAIDALVQAREEAKRSDFAAMKVLMDAYFAALTVSPVDESALASAQQALVTHMQADMQSNFTLDTSIVGLLTADELTALAACMANSAPPQPKQ